MRCALFGPIPGSLPSSSIRSWTGPSNKLGLRLTQRAAHSTGQRTQLLLRHRGDLVGGVGERANDQVLQRLDVVRVDDLRVDLHRYDLATALGSDLHQTAAGLTLHLGVGESLLGSHQLLLHLLCLSEQRRHVGRASGLHDGPLASWSRLGCAYTLRAVRSFKPRRRRANVAHVRVLHNLCCLRVGAPAALAAIAILTVVTAAPTPTAPKAVAG